MLTSSLHDYPLARSFRIVGVDDRNRMRLVQTPAGLVWEPNNSAAMLEEQLSQPPPKSGSRLPIQRGDVVLDCGANIVTLNLLAISNARRDHNND